MKKLTYTQKRIRAASRIIRHAEWQLRHSIRENKGPYAIAWEDHLQERINYFEEVKERIDISL